MQFPIAFVEGSFQPAKTTSNHLLLADEVKLCLTKYWKYTFNPHIIRPASLALLLRLSLPKKLL